MSITISGSDLNSLIQVATRFPAVGDSVWVNMAIVKGMLRVSRTGLALSVGEVKVEGSMDLLAVLEPQLTGFSTICAKAAKVLIDVNENEVKFRSRGRETVSTRGKGQAHKIPTVSGKTFEVSEYASILLPYLAAIAYSDNSRPELNCVMLLGDGRAMAINQKAVAVFQLGEKGIGRIALPIPMAKSLAENDVVSINGTETIVHSGIGCHVMPSPVKAQESFPVEVVDKYEKIKRTTIAICSGDKLSRAVEECDIVLGSLAKTDMVLTVTPLDKKLELSSENGPARFKTKLDAKCSAGDLIKIPMNEVRQLAGFFADEEKVEIAIGDKNNEIFIEFGVGWIMFPRWRDG
jgi:hypothetical protein